jgi:hypothetical protein
VSRWEWRETEPRDYAPKPEILMEEENDWFSVTGEWVYRLIYYVPLAFILGALLGYC